MSENGQGPAKTADERIADALDKAEKREQGRDQRGQQGG